MDKLKKEKIFFAIFRLLAFTSLLIVLTLIFYILSKGLKVISLNFIIDYPRNSFTEGGIFPAIVGSLYLVGLAIIFAVPVGVLGGIYLSEYTKENTLTEAIRLAIDTLSGIPSVIFGLFGLAVFCKILNLKVSLIAGGLTLSILILPTIFSATIESLKLVPKDFRDASYALGATKWQTTWEIVVKTALPNIITGVLLSIGRAIGETAPILFTGATFYTRGLPESIFEPVMALPYTIYGLLAEGTFPQKQVPIAFGASIVLIVLVFIITLPGIIIRNKFRSKKKW
jgi:phosphate transport system permease protein